ncbi:MAG: holo-ACP synthase [Armatimonadetes bacterium]|nr:holo-ACP synthase [Armatimonadota bacterium]
MIRAVGVDIVEIGRIERAMRKPRFVERIFTERERKFLNSPKAVAGRWACKEAVAKCLPKRIRWHEVEVLTGERGEPIVHFAGLEAIVSGGRFHVSISHERSHAVAVAVLEVD